MKLFVSPHNDDAVLFGAFTLQRERPLVLTVFDSHVQVARGNAHCDAATRRNEDIAAIRGVLGCAIQFGGVPDDNPDPGKVRAALEKWALAAEVWLPAVEVDGHAQHNLVGEIGLEVFSRAIVHRYLTYTTAGKSSHGRVVPFTGAMLRNKLQAMICYQTQIETDSLGCWPHFARNQYEYLAD